MARVERIGTVEMLKVKSSGRRLYLNLKRDLVAAYDIEAGQILKVEIKEKRIPEA